MKKTLAAVLAAAMALSTATVAFAHDYEVVPVEFSWNEYSTGGIENPVEFDESVALNITKIEDLTQAEIASLYEDGYISITPIVTDGASNLAGKPSTSLVRVKPRDVPTGVYTDTYVYIWRGENINKELANGKKVRLKNGDTLKPSTLIPVAANNLPTSDATAVKYVTWEWFVDSYGQANLDLLGSGVTNSFNGFDAFEKKQAGMDAETISVAASKAVQVGFKIAHTYGTGAKSATMKFRMTVRKNFTSDEGTDYSKGDTYTTDNYTFKAEYHQLSDYYKDMQLTTTEVSNNRVLLNGGELYNAIGDSKFSITFGDDIAMFEGKSAANQKTVNLYYSLDPIDQIVDQYPEVDFTFLTFKGNPAPTFQNTGSMVFAAKDDDTTIYLWDGEALEPLPSKYDATYKTETVSGIKKLGTYVISDRILEDLNEEPEEPAEPVDSTPVAEPDDDEGQNPNTGAC